MQAKYSREWGEKQQRSMSLKLDQEDLEGLPETLAQEFRRAEHTQRPAQILSVWARILGLRESGDFGKLQTAVNDMLDIVDAFVRESAVSMEYVSRGKTFRNELTGVSVQPATSASEEWLFAGQVFEHMPVGMLTVDSR